MPDMLFVLILIIGAALIAGGAKLPGRTLPATGRWWPW